MFSEQWSQNDVVWFGRRDKSQFSSADDARWGVREGGWGAPIKSSSGNYEGMTFFLTTLSYLFPPFFLLF